jgi:hypothetical protein
MLQSRHPRLGLNVTIKPTLMKKIVSLMLLVAFAFVVGCQKSDEEKAADAMKDATKAATNAIPK